MRRAVTTRRLAWATDIHLNFVHGDVRPFCDVLRSAAPHGLLITGDISEAETLERELMSLDRALWLPTWIVLGNHDFYGGSIAAVRAAVAGFCHNSRWLHYLPAEGVVRLDGETALVGHDGWADGRLGDYAGSTVVLNDYLMIADFAGLGAERRLQRLQRLGDEGAAHFRRVLPQALARHRQVIVATHVPPFPEACTHAGKIADAAHLPHFTCAAAGEVLVDIMRARPERHMRVLCGHTHDRSSTRILPNLLVKSGGASYGNPGLVEVIDTQELGEEGVSP
jgi:Icc protein